MNLCSKSDCTGCGACSATCPLNAIEMKVDDLGFRYPVVNKDKCCKCGKCESVCPQLNPCNKAYEDIVFASYCLDDKMRANSTSGGFATCLASNILKKGGVVYAHGFNTFGNNLNLECVRITAEEELFKTQGSKYVQSNMGNTYNDIQKDLNDEKTVLFIGTPCQVAGVLKYVNDPKNILITMSFICGGVPSQKFLNDYINELKVSKISDVKFRNKTIYSFRSYDNTYMLMDLHRWKSEYFIAFDEHISLRESCFKCSYAEKARLGDFTIGDFWGLKSSKINEYEINKGISLVIPSTNKAKLLFDELVHDSLIIAEKHQIQDAIIENPRLQSPVQKKYEVEPFRNNYLKYGFRKAVNKIYGKKYLIYRLKSKIKKIKILDRMYHGVINK